MEKETILAIKLKEYRQEYALTQADLAEKIKVSDKTISKWENGDTYPSKRNMLELSKILELPLEVLVVEDSYQQVNLKKLAFRYAVVAYVLIFGLSMLILSGRLDYSALFNQPATLIKAIIEVSIQCNLCAIPAAIIIGLVFYYYIFPKKD
ncbi:helix-turn-helix transcriptional regulator [Streptococcus thoraltensis]|uniref:helix-turn-helix transcriptional regulator n=1 Tax=Streptococcus thoraltensis TaxID=55085 RepID=UPI000377936A|nr:helix-turn-helix transcriptional regulator [Streptococcus thoraltensis]MDY4760729.1 helix-turn-helix transcriptional regulator [Streptococcus thoraltensis]